jgi:hypothetical protein
LITLNVLQEVFGLMMDVKRQKGCEDIALSLDGMVLAEKWKH